MNNEVVQAMVRHGTHREARERMRRSKYGRAGSFRARLLLVFALAVTPVVGLIIYNTLETRSERIHAAENEALLVAQVASVEQQRWIEDARGLLTSMSFHPAVLGDDEAACRRYLRAQLAEGPAYTVMGVATAAGEWICNTAVPATDPSEQAWFQRLSATRDFVVGDYQHGQLLGQLIVEVAYPILNTTGEVDRIIVAGLSLQWLNSIVANTGLPDGSSVVVLDSNAIVLARHPDDVAYVGQSLASSREVRAALAGEPGVGRGEALDGVRRIFGFVPYGTPSGGNIVIRVGIPESVAIGNINAYLLRNIVVLSLISLFAGWIVVYGTERMVLRNVRYLQRAVQRVAAGDLSARSGIPHGRNEIGELARGFDSMAAALQKRDEERTAMAAQREELVREQAARAAAEQSERYTTAQYVAGLMLGDASDLSAAMPGILKAVGENLDFDGVAFWIGDGEDFRCASIWRRQESLVPHDELVGSTDLPVHLLDQKHLNGTLIPAIVPVEPDTPWERYRLVVAEGVRTAVLMPVQAGGKLVAVLEALSRNEVSLNAPSVRPLATIVGHIRHFLERQEIAEGLRLSEARLAGIIGSAMDGIISIDQDRRVVLFNHAAERMFGYAKDEMMGQPLDRLLPQRSRELHQSQIEEFGDTRTASRVMGGRLPLAALRRDGTTFPIEATISQVEVAPERYFTVIVRDVTERVRAEEQMASSLREKEVLLREVHHRVKNNLQVVSSLLNLQAERAPNLEVLRVLEDSRSRVRSMALVHDRLYSSGQFDQIDFNGYLESLVSELIRLSQREKGNVQMTLDAEGVRLDLDVAIPLALITNELVTNALKYAFPEGGTGRITVRARAPKGPGNVVLSVEDNGVGVPAKVTDGETSLGLKLVLSLARQIGCNVQWRTDRGTAVDIVERPGVGS